nr:MAG TPA: hypothetical protein [Caudoviricetes sp.]
MWVQMLLYHFLLHLYYRIFSNKMQVFLICSPIIQ